MTALRWGYPSILLVLLPACAAAPEDRGPVAAADPSSAPVRRLGAYDSVRTFVEAVNRLDAPVVAEYVDWDLWVAADPKLFALVAQLRRRYQESPPPLEDLQSHPIQGSTVTLAEVLDPQGSLKALATAASQRFELEMAKDFAPEVRRNDARIAAWHEDSRETSASILMPNGVVVEFHVIGSSGQYRLVPRW
jgi:hypothetical protein